MLNHHAVSLVALASERLAMLSAYSDKYHASCCVEFAYLVGRLSSHRANTEAWRVAFGRLHELLQEIEDRRLSLRPPVSGS